MAGDARVVNDVTIPDNFRLLHARAGALVEASPRLALHLLVVEYASNLADMFRQFLTEVEHRKVLQLHGMRVFNAFCACVKLADSGYGQASAGLLRGAVETIFLLDLFSSDADALERWRTAEPRDQEREYSPFDVRVAFDGLRRHQLRSCPLNVCGKVSAQVLTMRWILTASVLVVAVVGLSTGSPPAPDALTPEQWRERAAAYFPGWTRMAAATRPNSPITDSGRC